MRYPLPFLLASLILLSSATFGAGDPAAGKQKSQLCSQCHGVTGNSTDENIPKLSGQLQNYIVLAVTEFLEGIRKDPIMSNMATTLTNPQDIEDIAAYFASQPRMQGTHNDDRLLAEGEKLFTEHRCNYCHGDEGKQLAPFRESQPPVIGGQHRVYLVKAMKDIRDGKRPADLYDLMPKIIAELSDAELEAIAAYLSQI